MSDDAPGDAPGFDWDPAKAASNRAKHKVSFEEARRFAFETALIVEDGRHDYGEVRLQAAGRIAQRTHVLVYTMRDEAIWVISLRKANKREISAYERFVASRG